MRTAVVVLICTVLVQLAAGSNSGISPANQLSKASVGQDEFRVGRAGGVVPRKAQQLVCAEPTFDLGHRASGRSVEHTFSVRNAGKIPIRIERLESAMSATITTAECCPFEIAPGQERQIRTSVFLKSSYAGTSIRKVFRVVSSLPTEEILELSLKADVVHPIEHPRTVSVGQLRPSESPSVSFEVTVYTDDAPRLDRVVSSGAWVTPRIVELRPVGASGHWRVTCEIKGIDSPSAAWMSDLALLTSSGQSMGSVRVVGHTEAVTLSQSFLNLGRVRRRASNVGNIALAAPADGFKLSGLSVTPSDRIGAELVETGSTRKILLHTMADAPEGPIRATVTVRVITSGGEETKRVFVIGTIDS